MNEKSCIKSVMKIINQILHLILLIKSTLKNYLKIITYKYNSIQWQFIIKHLAFARVLHPLDQAKPIFSSFFPLHSMEQLWSHQWTKSYKQPPWQPWDNFAWSTKAPRQNSHRYFEQDFAHQKHWLQNADPHCPKHEPFLVDSKHHLQKAQHSQPNILGWSPKPWQKHAW